MKLLKMKKTVALIFILSALMAAPAQAVLTIEITKGVDVGIPIAIVPFSWRGAAVAGESMSNIIEADLTRSGRFDSIPRATRFSRQAWYERRQSLAVLARRWH